MQLSKNFTLEEMTRSLTAEMHHIDNTPNAAQTANLKTLCDKVLEQAREDFGPMLITSGYRTPELNKLVGGVSTSYHLKGMAADIHCNYQQECYRLAALLLRSDYCDMVIVERRKRKYWVHVQWSDVPRHKLTADLR